MRRLLLTLVIALSMADSAEAQQGRGGGAAWQSLVDAEVAFARAASRGRVSDAFLQVLAPDGILFRPGPVPGRAATEANPTPPGQQLEWHPRVAAVSSSGDLGFTSGPYVFRASPTDSVGGAGHFLSVWKKDQAQTWRLALDVGTPHAALPDHFVMRDAVPLWTPDASPAASPGGGANADMLQSDDRFSELLSQRALEEAASTFGTRESLSYRVGAVPVRGLATLRDSAVPAGEGWRAQRAGSGISAAGDLGYTYGSWTGADNRTVYWVRVWRRVGGAWRIAASLVA